MKKLIIAILAVLFMMGACTNMRLRDFFGNSLQDKMMNYINEKYDDSFTFLNTYGGRIGADYHKIIVSSEKYPNKEIVVTCYVSDDGETYSDNYLSIKYEDDTRACIEEMIKSLYGENCFIYYRPNLLSMPSGASNDMSFDEYIGKATSGISFTAIVNVENAEVSKEAELESLKKALHNAGLCCSGTIYFDDRGQDLTRLTPDNYYSECLNSEEYAERLSFIANEDFEFTKAAWE